MDYLMEADVYRYNCEINILSETAICYINEDNKLEKVAHIIAENLKKIIEKIKKFIRDVIKPKIKKIKDKITEIKTKNIAKKFENNKEIKIRNIANASFRELDPKLEPAVTELLENANNMGNIIESYMKQATVIKNESDLQEYFMKYQNDIQKFLKLKHIDKNDIESNPFPIEKYNKEIKIKSFTKTDYEKYTKDLESMSKFYDNINKDYHNLTEKLDNVYDIIFKNNTVFPTNIVNLVMEHINISCRYMGAARNIIDNRILYDVNNIKLMELCLGKDEA